MKNLLDAIYLHFSELTAGVHTDFWIDLNGAMYKERAPQGYEFPYCVFTTVAEAHSKTFGEHFKEPLIQFSIFTDDSSTDNIEDMYTDLKSLYDEAEFNITDNTLVWCRIQSAVLIPDIVTTKRWTREIWHYAVDFELMVSYTP